MTDLRHFKYFLAVAQHGGFSNAARALKVSQPSISMAVKTLEEEVGSSLLERGPKGVTLTAVGRVFEQRARATVKEADRAFEEARYLTGLSGGTISTGMSSILSSFLGNDAVCEFYRRHPGVKVNIAASTHSAHEVEQAIDGGVWDFGLVLQSADLRSQSHLTIEKLIKVKTSIYVAADHPLGGCESVSLSDIAQYDWILSVFASPDILFKEFDEAKIDRPHVAMVTNTFDLIREFASSSTCVCILPEPLAENVVNSGRLVRVPIQNFQFNSMVVLVYATQGLLSAAAQAFIDVIREVAHKSHLTSL